MEKTIKTMTSAQDHKRAKDGDQGLNTAEWETFSPSPFYTKEVDEFCKKYVYQPTVDAMAAEGREFKGIIFFGLMLTADRSEGTGIQCPFRRSGSTGCSSAYEERHCRSYGSLH